MTFIQYHLIIMPSSARDRARIEQLINKLKRSGFLPQSAPAALDLACDADARLFRTVITDRATSSISIFLRLGKLIITCALALMGLGYPLRMTGTLFPATFQGHVLTLCFLTDLWLSCI